MAEWADKHRRLTSQASAEPGKWRTSRAPYQRGIMEAITDPDIPEVAFMKSAQVGGTEIILNSIGYIMDREPAPMLYVMPTIDMAETMSKDRIGPMIKSCAPLRVKVSEPRAKDSSNTLLHKTFPGGHLTLAGANSPASLASRPVKDVLLDEIDKYPPSAGSEGDPEDLAQKRSQTFAFAKLFRTSTPTIKGVSRIERRYEASDKRRYYVPCPHCGEFQTLQWGNVSWPKDEQGNHLPDQAVYACAKCGSVITDADKPSMLAAGEWRATAPFKGVAGFHISELYSPWSSFPRIAAAFLKAKHNGREALKVWTNTCLGETWEEEGETVEAEGLMGRREKWSDKIPAGVAVLTAGVDVQDDRLEIEVVGWGRGKESWSVDHRVFYGATSIRANPVWADLQEYLSRVWEGEGGAMLTLNCVCVDSGHHAQTVYEFVRPLSARRVFAVKGSSKAGVAPVYVPAKSKARKTRIIVVGTDTLKADIFSWLRITEPGPGFMHFPMERDDEYFKQLTAEKIITSYHKGFPRREWVKTRPRNEALDLRVYALAALLIINPRLDKPAPPPSPTLSESGEEPEAPPPVVTTRPRGPRRGGWVGGW